MITYTIYTTNAGNTKTTERKTRKAALAFAERQMERDNTTAVQVEEIHADNSGTTAKVIFEQNR